MNSGALQGYPDGLKAGQVLAADNTGNIKPSSAIGTLTAAGLAFDIAWGND
jgi:hypothetical protein